MSKVIELVFSALLGGLGVAIFQRLTTSKKYEAEVRKLEVEADGSLIEQWQELYIEVKKIQVEQNIRIKTLELENEKLRHDYMILQQEFNFKEFKEK